MGRIERTNSVVATFSVMLYSCKKDWLVTIVYSVTQYYPGIVQIQLVMFDLVVKMSGDQTPDETVDVVVTGLVDFSHPFVIHEQEGCLAAQRKSI